MGELTMLTLSSRSVESRNLSGIPDRMVVRVSDQRDRPRALRAREAFLATEGNLPEGFGVYVALAKDAAALSDLAHVNGEAPCRVVGMPRNGRRDCAVAFGKHREQAFEPVLVIGHVLNASPLSISIPGGWFTP